MTFLLLKFNRASSSRYTVTAQFYTSSFLIINIRFIIANLNIIFPSTFEEKLL